MIASLLLSVFSLAPVDESAKSDLAAAVKKLEAAQSYHCDYSGAPAREGGKEAGGAVAGAAGGTGKPARGGEGWSIDWQKGKPVHLKNGQVEMFREDKNVAMLDAKSGKWVAVDRNAKPAGDGAGAAESDKSHGMMVRMAGEVDRIVFPHMLVKDLGPKLTEVTKSEAGGASTFVATLSKDAAREFSGMKDARPGKPAGEGREGREGREGGGKGSGKERKGGKGRPAGGDGGDEEGDGDGMAFAAAQEKPGQDGAKGAGARDAAEATGTMTFVVGSDGVTSITLEVSVKAQQTRVIRKSWKLSGVDKTMVEVPAEAAAALGAK